MSYGDYSNRATNIDSTKILLNFTPDKKGISGADKPATNLETKTSTISQPIFAKFQASGEAKSKELSEHQADLHSENVSNNILQRSVKTNTVGTPAILKQNLDQIQRIPHKMQADLITKNLNNIQGPPKNNSLSGAPSKYEAMTKKELLLAFKDPKNKGDIEIILTRIAQLKNQTNGLNKVDNFKKNEETTQLNNKFNIFKTKASNASQIQNTIHEVRLTFKSQDLRFWDDVGTFRIPNEADLSKPEKLFMFNEKGEIGGADAKLLAQFTKGQTYGRENEKGDIILNEAQDLHAIDVTEINFFRDSYATLLINQSALKSEDHAGTKQTQTFNPLQYSQDHNPETNKKTKIATAEKFEKILNSTISAKDGKSLKQINEERIEKLLEYLDQKFQKIQTEVKSHTIINEHVSFKELNLKELQAEHTKIDTELKQILETLREGRDYDIPLATLVKFERIDVNFQNFIEAVPDENKSDAFRELVTVKTELMKVVKENMNINKGVRLSAPGRSG